MANSFAWNGAAAAVLMGLALAVPAPHGARAEDVTLNVWSHEADEDAKVAYRELAAKNLEKAHPGVHVKITWYEKNPLLAALKTALPAGQGPDVLYVEPDWTEYVEAGYLEPLDSLVDWNNIEPWARKVWIHNGKTYGVPQEAYTNEIYYNKDLLKKLGVELPANAQFTQAQFLDLVKKAKAANIVPIAQGVGDRPFPGAYILSEALLRKLGKDDYRNLWTGKLSYEDPRVVEVFKWTKELVDAGAYPKNFICRWAAGTPGAPSCRRTRAASPRTSRSASCSSRRWTAAPATSARPRRSAPASRSTPPASIRTSPPNTSTRCRRRRWASAGSRRSICRPGSRPT